MAEAWYAEKRQRCPSTSSASEIFLAAARRGRRGGDQSNHAIRWRRFFKRLAVHRSLTAPGQQKTAVAAPLGLREPVLPMLQLNPSPTIGHLAADVDLAP